MTAERILALALAAMLVVNAVQVFMLARTKKTTDAIQTEASKIHVLVNSRLTLALAANEALREQIEGLIGRIAELTEARGEAVKR